MKYPRLGFAAFFVACFLSAAALAADPSGSWKWTIDFNGQPFDSVGKFDLKDGKLTGTLSGGQMGELPISDGSFKDGTIAFTLAIEGGGNNFVVKYQGKLEGDTITGNIDIPGFNGGEAMKIAWKAQRVKDEKKPDAPEKSK